jgi:hypothetical protein
MAVERCRERIAVMLLAIACCLPAQAAAPPARQRKRSPAPLSLLEFLGGHNPMNAAHKAADGRWLQFLSQLDLHKKTQVARPPAPHSDAHQEHKR